MSFYHESHTRSLGLRPTCDMPYTDGIDGRSLMYNNRIGMEPNRLYYIRGTKMELDTQKEMAKLVEDYIDGKFEDVSEENIQAVHKIRLAATATQFDALVGRKLARAEERRPVLTLTLAVPGTLARLRGGGPIMTLEGLEDRSHVFAVWFDRGERRHASFHISALVLVRGIPQE
jgi:uncharacterized protein YodC (DUF2158 family)